MEVWFGNNFSNYIVLVILKHKYPSIEFYVIFLIKIILKKYLGPTLAAVFW